MMTTTDSGTDSGPAIELTGLRKAFGGGERRVVAVDGIDLTVPRGQILAFLGPNGAGKTTTLDMVLGLTDPNEGEARVLGRSPRRAVREGRISAVLQSGGLLRDLTVAETVRMIASTFTEHVPVPEVIERAGIASIARRRVSKCSGGEQQRLRFALALLPDPDLLVLDEPTAGMDVSARAEFWDTMRADAASGRTVVFATHYLEEADTFAERIVMVSGGRIVADGSVSDIRAQVSGRTVSARIPAGEFERVSGALEAMDVVHTLRREGERLVVHASDSDAVALALLRELGGTDLEVEPGSLDQAFMTLTARPGATKGEVR